MERCKTNVLKDELTCPVCFEVFGSQSMPIIFFCCQQVYCQKCVEQLTTCPTCRTDVSQCEPRPCRKLLSILECLCSVCHRHEKDRKCIDCKLNLCDDCLGEHLIIHEDDIKSKRAELKQVLQVAQDFTLSLKEGLTDLQTTIDKKLRVLCEDFPYKNGDTNKMGAEVANSKENIYINSLNEIRQLREEIYNHIIPVLMTIAQNLNVPVPAVLTDFNCKPLFQSLEVISNVDVALPPDALSFINAVSVDQVLSQIVDQPSVDRRILVNQGDVQFQLLQDESATCNITVRNSTFLATNRARVLIFKDGIETALPCVFQDNNHPISGLTVVGNDDGSESLLAVDCSCNIYEHCMSRVDEKWKSVYVGEASAKFVDIAADGDSIYLADSTSIHVISWRLRERQRVIQLLDEEQCPKQLILMKSNLVLLRLEHQKFLLLKSLESDIEADKVDFNFFIHHMQFNYDRRILSVIGHHEASDHYALHTYKV